MGNQRRPITYFRCGDEEYRSCEFSSYHMKIINQGGKLRVNLVQTKIIAEGEQQDISPNVGESLITRRTLIIPENNQVQTKSSEYSWLETNIFIT